MNKRILSVTFTVLAAAICVMGQSSWLDRPLNRNWNAGSGQVPQAPGSLAIEPQCRAQLRPASSQADRQLQRAGWTLFGASQEYGTTTVVMGLNGFDGMCRPTEYNAFVFVSNRFAGTLSPVPMNSRTDGSLVDSDLISATNINATFNRYSSTDALCCPSRTSTVLYTISAALFRPVVKADNVNTAPVCTEGSTGGGEVHTQDNIVNGTVTYHQKIALPRTAVVSVKLLDASRQDVSAILIAEDTIQTRGKQVPIDYNIVYDPTKIREQRTYVVRAEIRDGQRLLFTTDTSYPVITKGNPKVVNITVIPVGTP